MEKPIQSNLRTNSRQVPDGMNNPSDRNPLLQSGIRDANGFLSLTGILSAAALPVAMLFLGGDWVTRETAMGAYYGTVVALFAAFLLVFLAAQWFQKRAGLTACGLPAAYVTLVVPIVCVLIALTVIRKISPAQYAWAAIIVHMVFLPIGWFSRKQWMTSAFLSELNKRVIQLLPLFYAGIFWGWAYIGISIPLPGRKAVLLLVIGLAALAAYMRFGFLRNILPAFRKFWWVYLLLGLALIGLVYQPELPFDRHHLDFFLAPINNVLHGKWLFIDATSQYGVGVIYALAAVLRALRLPVSYAGFSLVVDALFILQYALLFLILRRATGSLLLSLAGIGAVIYFNFLTTVWTSMLRIPAQGPLRYGMIYLLLGVALYGIRGGKKPLRFLELILLGAASLWSLETFLYVLVSVDAFHFVADILYAERVREGILVFGKRIAAQAGIILLSWGVWLAVSFIATGNLPNISYYLEYYGNYTSAELYGHTVDFRSLNIVIVTAIYLLSILAVLFLQFKRRNHLSVETASLLIGLSVSGLVQNIYYFVYEIDYHLTLICIPLILVLALWLAVILHSPSGGIISTGVKASFALAVLVSVWICAFQASPNLYYRFRSSILFVLFDAITTGERIQITNPYLVQPSNDSVNALVTLIEKYAPTETRIAIFARNEDEVESLLITGKTQLVDITNPLMCSASASYITHIENMAREVSGEPEYIFYDSGEGALITLQQDAFQQLMAGATYQIIDRMGDIVVYKKVTSE